MTGTVPCRRGDSILALKNGGGISMMSSLEILRDGYLTINLMVGPRTITERQYYKRSRWHVSLAWHKEGSELKILKFICVWSVFDSPESIAVVSHIHSLLQLPLNSGATRDAILEGFRPCKMSIFVGSSECSIGYSVTQRKKTCG